MTITETVNYNIHHIGAIRTNKDHLSSEYDVEIYITRRRFGNFQEVEIVGLQKNIRKVKSALLLVVEQAEQDFMDYKERKRKRDSSKKKLTHISETKSAIVNKPRNPFSALAIESDDEEDNEEDIDTDNDNSGEGLCWADM